LPPLGANTLKQAAVLEAKGYKPVFIPASSETQDLSILSSEAKSRGEGQSSIAYPIAWTNNPANRGLRKFSRKANWRYSYNVADLPGEYLPGQLNQSIVIPASTQRQDNVIEISVSANDPNARACGDIAQSVAQLLPETVLRSSEARTTGLLQDVQDLVVEASTVMIDAEDLTVAEASAASHLIASLKPAGWEVSPTATRARITVVSPRVSFEQSQLSDDRTHWLIYSDNGNAGQVIALPVGDEPVSQLRGVALLVSIGEGTSDPSSPQTQLGEAAGAGIAL